MSDISDLGAEVEAVAIRVCELDAPCRDCREKARIAVAALAPQLRRGRVEAQWERLDKDYEQQAERISALEAQRKEQDRWAIDAIDEMDRLEADKERLRRLLSNTLHHTACKLAHCTMCAEAREALNTEREASDG